MAKPRWLRNFRHPWALGTIHQETISELESKLQIRSVGKQIREKVMALPGLRDLELNLFLTVTGSGL